MKIALNVNIPAVSNENIKGIKVCKQANAIWEEKFDKRYDPYGREYFWMVGNFVNHDNDPDNEFDCFKWVSYWYPLNVIISFKEKVYREALNKLKYSFCKEFNNV